jgi:hypothetical protein
MNLRNGQFTNDPRLDRVRHVDLRSLDYPVSELLTADQYSNPRSYTWRLETYLDQGPDGACVGFAFSHELAARPGVVSGINNTYAKHLYWDAQRADPWLGGSYPDASPQYEGTSTVAGAQVAKRRGFIKEYRWALNIMDLVTAVGYSGPAVMGVDWYEDMIDPDEGGYVHPYGDIVGGHCVCLIGVRIVRTAIGKVDMLRSYFVIHNSWGPDWGVDGRCGITLAELMVLWPAGDFCIPIGRVAAVAA